MPFKRLISILSLLFMTGQGMALELAPIFSDHMVLQRDMKVPIFGRGRDNEEVFVFFRNQKKSTRCNAKGEWKVELDPLTVGVATELKVKGEEEAIVFKDVLVGEVWICSGQSNMEFPLFKSDAAAKDIPQSENNNIRIFTVTPAWSGKRADNFKCKSWQAAGPETVKEFSAIGYYFGKYLYSKNKAPIGLINCSWGGTTITAWTPIEGVNALTGEDDYKKSFILKDYRTEENLKISREYIDIQKKWTSDAEERLRNDTPLAMPPRPPLQIMCTSPSDPSVIFNAMVNPLVRFAIRGVIWYQGERDRNDGESYRDKLKALINGWRLNWLQDKMFFYIVQLAPFDYKTAPHNLPAIWEAQAKAVEDSNDCAMVVINDLGNLNDIHPTSKMEVGKRLAIAALNKTYANNDETYRHAKFKSYEIIDNKVIVSFDDAKSLATADGNPPNWFEIAGENGVFYTAESQIDGNKVILTSPQLAKPQLVRFAWHMKAQPNLINDLGYPTSAFRAGKSLTKNKLEALIDPGDGWDVVYAFNPVDAKVQDNGKKLIYDIDHSKELEGKAFKRIAYFLLLERNDGKEEYIYIEAGSFTKNVSMLGVPDFASKHITQMYINNLCVKSNVSGIKNGSYERGGYLEFFYSDPSPINQYRIPYASDLNLDWGDKGSISEVPGIGSMQIHNWKERQVLFAFNNWKTAKDADIGIGNSPSTNIDWTNTKSARNYKKGQMLILIK
ncbi:MAG: sialate O-acetylesterase [Victivallales bacterium]